MYILVDENVYLDYRLVDFIIEMIFGVYSIFSGYVYLLFEFEMVVLRDFVVRNVKDGLIILIVVFNGV